MSAPNLQADSSSVRTGIAFALIAQLIWGLFPVYLKLLASTPAMNIVAHRIVWSFALLALVTLFGSILRIAGLPRWSDVRAAIADRATLKWLGIASVLILINWLGFVFAIELNRTMDAAVGYYICPQVVVILGVFLEKERLTARQWIAFGITSGGVLVMAASTSGIPWLGLLVAVSFGFYALAKKRIAASALTSLTFETGFLLLPAVGFLLYQLGTAGGKVATAEPVVSPAVLQTLLVATGIVTVAPLALYAGAIKRLPLSVAGVLQFLGPTMQFFLSVFVFKDPFDLPRMIGIVFVWLGVGVYLTAKLHRKS